MKYLNNTVLAKGSWPTKALTSAVLLSLTAMVSQTAGSAERKPIGDLEIYQSASSDAPKIFMMLDFSSSMGEGSISSDYGYCDNNGNNSYGYQTDEAILASVKDENGNYQPIKLDRPDGKGNKNYTFTPQGCQVKNTGGDKEFDRLSRLKLALIELFADKITAKQGNTAELTELTGKASVSNDYEIGIGIFSRRSKDARVLAPLVKLTPENRIELITKIVNTPIERGTPMAQGLAEAGAYMMGTTTLSPGTELYSGFLGSVESSKTEDKSRYQSPLTTERQCSGNGIYLMTDGSPYNSSKEIASSVMNKSLEGSSLKVDSCDGLTGGNSSGAWGCMAEYTQLLRDPSNPIGKPIRTATAGFGKDFIGLNAKKTIYVDGKPVEVVDCEGDANTTESENALNLCRLGQRWGDDELKDESKKPKIFGNGGFYYISGGHESDGGTTDDPRGTKAIQTSLLDFAASLNYVIKTSPSGTITVPDDPYRASNQLPYAYLPMLDPDIASVSSIWRGNLKKYNLDQGTLFGNNNKPLYKDVSGRLKETTQDIWQVGDYKQQDGTIINNAITAGGVYAQLSAPSSGLASLRTLYVEDFKATDDTTPVLRKIGVDTDGKPTGFGDLKDTSTYTQLNKRRLLNFLGFESVLTNDGEPTSEDDVEDLVLTKPTKETKVLGGVVHSKPTAISYSSTLDDNGRIIDPRDDYVLFGSMDGALHLVDADDGKETVAIIPKVMMQLQPEALVLGSKRLSEAEVGKPYFGVDAPWLVTTDYKYDLEGKKVTVDTASGKGMFAYGGLRMGGEGLSGIDITDKSAPKILFTIGSNGLFSSTSGKSTTVGFGRIGQIWSQPTAAKIRLKKDDKEPTNVLIFGGGYDMRYEQDGYVATSTAPAKGNAIYMINAKTGALIWSASQSGSTTNNANMIHSITGGITVLDRDNDGLMDHLYAADLGGQVFRADFENARPNKFGFSEVASFSNKRVTRILDTTPTDSKYTYRFYERPVVSFYRREAGPNNGKIFAMVNVISGNRSAPLSTLRDDDTHTNRLYGIIDDDVTKANLYENEAADGLKLNVKSLTESKLVNLATHLSGIADAADDSARKTLKDTAKAAMIAGTKHGWYYPLTRFDGYDNVRYSKGIGDSVVINDLLYTTVYNPDKKYYEVDSCTARIAGGSERQLYCLPYGVCMDNTSVSGTGGYVPAGEGIQELTLGAFNKDNTDLKVLIGTSTVTDRIAEAKRSKYGADTNKDDSNFKDFVYAGGNNPIQASGDGSAAEFIFNERYTLQPKAWYQQAQKQTVTAAADPEEGEGSGD